MNQLLYFPISRAEHVPLRLSPVSLTSVPGKVMEQLILDTLSKHLEEKVIRSTQYGFTNEK